MNDDRFAVVEMFSILVGILPLMLIHGSSVSLPLFCQEMCLCLF